jgi:phosphoglycerate kinase
MSNIIRFEELDLRGKKVLLRAGFDVTIEHGMVTDTSRIDALKDTMLAILEKGSLIILAHQGRPKGKPVPEESQKPLVPVLEKLLGRPIAFAPSCVGPETVAMAAKLNPGEVLLLENVRYDEREEKNDPAFAKELAALADCYVCDAFSNAHRAHASMVGVPALLPHAMGLQMQKEVDALSKVRGAADGLCVIVSGAKLETKVPVIEAFLGRAQTIVVGGAIANTFLAASGKPIGASLSDPAEVPTAKRILDAAAGSILLPVDAVVAPSPEKTNEARSCMVDEVTPSDAILDLGPASAAAIADAVSKAKTVVWNGPLGYCEKEAFSATTIVVANAMASATAAGAFTVIGGGDTLEIHERYGLSLDPYSFVSTGGGAMLEFLADGDLPALAALRS